MDFLQFVVFTFHLARFKDDKFLLKNEKNRMHTKSLEMFLKNDWVALLTVMSNALMKSFYAFLKGIYF